MIMDDEKDGIKSLRGQHFVQFDGKGGIVQKGEIDGEKPNEPQVHHSNIGGGLTDFVSIPRRKYDNMLAELERLKACQDALATIATSLPALPIGSANPKNVKVTAIAKLFESPWKELEKCR